MLPLFFFIVSFGFLVQGKVTEYSNNRLVSEHLKLYENSRIFLDIVEKYNQSTAYIHYLKSITTKDNIHLNVVATRSDGMEFPIPDNPINICKILADEMAQENQGLIQFQLSRVFNLDGLVCPIKPGKRRLTPYLFPSNLRLYTDMGCGEFVYKISLEDCNEIHDTVCKPLISAKTTVVLSSNECSNTYNIRK